ncbi:hypothetical protein E05_04320 [Plautia stali symbiont]|nr:hypothetical protein E05_04320 [Plautia stali symbiont]
MTTVTIKEMGQQSSIRIPSSVMQSASLSVDDKLELSVEDGKLILVPLREKVYSLDALLDEITDDNVHDKIDFGPSVGKERI